MLYAVIAREFGFCTPSTDPAEGLFAPTAPVAGQDLNSQRPGSRKSEISRFHAF
jgi:hypothetical protein